MPYRQLKLEVVGATDPNLKDLLFGPLALHIYQGSDQSYFSARKVIQASDAEVEVPISPVTVGYFCLVLSDTPIQVRLNSPSGTQFTLKRNSVAAVNFGAVRPFNCCFALTGLISSLRLAPVPGQSGAANVVVVVTGDPAAAY